MFRWNAPMKKNAQMKCSDEMLRQGRNAQMDAQVASICSALVPTVGWRHQGPQKEVTRDAKMQKTARWGRGPGMQRCKKHPGGVGWRHLGPQKGVTRDAKMQKTPTKNTQVGMGDPIGKWEQKIPKPVKKGWKDHFCPRTEGCVRVWNIASLGFLRKPSGDWPPSSPARFFPKCNCTFVQLRSDCYDVGHSHVQAGNC